MKKPLSEVVKMKQIVKFGMKCWKINIYCIFVIYYTILLVFGPYGEMERNCGIGFEGSNYENP
jgi:hypothetical protein